jgi:fatty acid-binding protein DegV
MAKNIIQSAPHKEIQLTLQEAMQGICYWVAVLSKNSLPRFGRLTGAKLLTGLKFSVVVGQ